MGLAVSLDMAKAFDRVRHEALLAKLPFYGLPENLCNWIASFLNGRSSKVAIDGFCSEHMPVNAGVNVPQSYVLTPNVNHFFSISMTCSKIVASIAMQMIAQWTLFTPAAQVFLGKRRPVTK